MIGEYEKAIVAGKKAIQLSPQEELYKNNLAYAEKQQAYFASLSTKAKSAPTYENWVQLSLEWYNAGNYVESKKAAEEAVLVNPNDAAAWNNICAACNKIGDYQRGIEACTKAVSLKPDWEIAINNLKESQRLQAAQPTK